jgi:hypothetical protein
MQISKKTTLNSGEGEIKAKNKERERMASIPEFIFPMTESGEKKQIHKITSL